MPIWLLASSLSFLIGAIPFGSLAARFKGIDLRKIGSGNVGATNVYRALGWAYAIPIFILDAAKGFLPVWWILRHSEDPLMHILIGCCAVLGHSFSPFLKFKGGKGVATTAGILLALCPNVFGIVFSIGIMSILIFRYVAPVSIICSILTPILMAVFEYDSVYIAAFSLLALVIIFRHRSNIVRLISGKENKL